MRIDYMICAVVYFKNSLGNTGLISKASDEESLQ